MATRPKGDPVPTRTRRRPLTLISTDDCHLCDHAVAVLAGLEDRCAITVRHVGAESPEALAAESRGVPLLFLPVLLDEDGSLLAYGRLSARRLERELAR
jgi:hypothetical protein